MENLVIVSQLILQLLSNRSPEYGARLKQELNRELITRGLGPFNEKAYGYKKFSDFVVNALSDKVLVEPPEGAGDIHISLRHPVAGQGNAGASALSAVIGSQPPVIRSDVWQAFINPDHKRKRFFHRETRAIRHFREDWDDSARAEIEGSPTQFVEIEFIEGKAQLEWMRAFLDALRLPPEKRASFDALIDKEYSSAINSTFTRALGEHGDSWRRFRTNNVTEVIRRWCQEHGVRFDDLCVPKSLGEPATPLGQSNETQLSPRQQANKLLDLLTEDDIGKFVIPLLLSSILITSRR